MARHSICPLAALAVGGLMRVEVDGVAICLAHTEDGSVYAIADECTHEQVALSEGELYGCEVECPRHSSTFDLRTGEASGTPAMIAVKTYQVVIDNEVITLEL